jgi:hypothetical protein
VAAKFDVKADFREVQRMFKELGPGVNRATSRAINKTATPVRNEAAKQIQQKRNLNLGVIKKELRLFRATYNRLTASIVATGKPIPIRHFKANQTRHGVTVAITKGRGNRVRLQRHGNKSFMVARLGNNVFVRQTKRRLPIMKWTPVPGIPTVFVQKHLLDAMTKVASTVFPKRFREEINFEIQRAQAKARGR